MKSVKIMVTGLLMCLICIFCLILSVNGVGGIVMGAVGTYGFFISVLVTIIGICTKGEK